MEENINIFFSGTEYECMWTEFKCLRMGTEEVLVNRATDLWV